MGLSFRRRTNLGRGTSANVSGSGASVSKRVGKRVTVNSRGRFTVRLPGGFRWRGRL
jgi:hypothetical protein